MDKLLSLIFKITERTILLAVTVTAAILTAFGRIIMDLIAHRRSRQHIRHQTSVNHRHRPKPPEGFRADSVQTSIHGTPGPRRLKAKRDRRK